MPVFISYSHADKVFVDRLALQLVKARAHVWLDRWEINVGDSLIRRVEEAVTGASALVVVLSKASMESEWVRKELSAGLVRELEEKRVVVMPALLEDCEIPLFLREKKYADFRSNFDEGLNELLKGIAKVTNDTRTRVETPKWHTDWAIDWGRVRGNAQYVITLVDQAIDRPYSCLTIIRVKGNQNATERYDLYEREGLDWVFRHIMMSMLAETARELDLRILLRDPYPQRLDFGFRDDTLGILWTAKVECRLLGEDTGADVLLDIAGQLRGPVAHMRESGRETTAAEQERTHTSAKYPAED